MHKLSNFLMASGAALLLAALALFCYNQQQNAAAGSAADAVLVSLQEQLAAQDAAILGDEVDTTQPAEMPPLNEEAEEEVLPFSVDGTAYAGILSLPTLGMALPVADEWSYDTLKTVPCRYSGSVEGDDLVLCGHNYRRHFGPLSNLKPGDRISYTEADGTLTEYEVVAVEVLQPTDIADMTQSGWPLTLFTCTYSGQTRLTVRCDKLS